MEKVGIADLQERFMNEVSGGQLQRASICRAVINNPKIIFVDEPTGALNSSSSMKIMEIFNQLNQEGIAICMVTHDSNVASYAHRVLFMIDGVLESELTFENESRERRIERIRNQMDKYTI